MGNIVNSIIWLIVLIFISFWLAALAAGFYIILLPLSVCIEAITPLTDLLLDCIQFPKFCAQAMVDGKSLC